MNLLKDRIIRTPYIIIFPILNIKSYHKQAQHVAENYSNPT